MARFEREGYEEWARLYSRRAKYRPIGERLLALRFLPGGRFAIVEEDFRVGNIVVPRGFVTDGASVPLPFRATLARYGPWTESAVVHDFLCRHGAVSRRAADRIFLDLLRRARVNFFQRARLYLGVRIGACVPWARPGLPRIRRRA